MRIVHLSTCLEYYGGEVCLDSLARGLVRRGHEVSCLVRPRSALAARLAGTGVTTVEMPLVDWFDPGTVRRVRTWLQAQRPDILASHIPRDYFIAAVASLGLPVGNVATRHLLKPISWPALKRPFLRRFDAFVAVSHAVAREVRRTSLVASERVVTVNNGIDRPGAPQPGQALRRRFGVPAGAPVIGFVGRLCPDKGPASVLRAAALLLPRHPDLRLFLVGGSDHDRQYRRYLVNLCDELGLGDRVHLPGYLDHAARYGRDFDVQVVASVAEPFGLVTLEAMANGVPIIATSTGGSPEIVRDGVEGFLVDPGDIGGLANRLDCLLGSAGLRAEMGRRGRLRYRRRFTAEHMVSATEDVYCRILDRRRRISARGSRPLTRYAPRIAGDRSRCR